MLMTQGTECFIGLSEKEAQENLKKYGFNEIPSQKKRNN